MKKVVFNIVTLLVVISIVGCRKYLDINSDPASPSVPSLPALLPSVQSSMARALGLDGRLVGQYNQYWHHTSGTGDAFEIHGGNQGGAGGGNQLWRDFYQIQGPSINLIIKKGIEDQQWDYVGVALALRAWGFQTATDQFSDLPFYQAWEENRVFFDYEDQPTIYRGVDSICRLALQYLGRTDGKVNQTVLGRGDIVYGGDRQKWIRFVYGLLARNYHHQTNKASYSADSVLKYTSLAMASSGDDFLIRHDASRNDDSNPLGTARDNFSVRRQSRFIVQLLDGTNFFGTTVRPNRDPRIRGMLNMSPDTSTITTNMPTLNGGYRFMSPGTAYTLGTPGTAAFRQAPSTVWGDSTITNPGVNNFTQRGIGKYLFANNAVFPVMTYHEMQFIRAEAAFRKGDFATAHSAYLTGIQAHFNFVNARNTSTNNYTTITASEISSYLSSAAVKQTPATLTLTDIMLQKYIGDWGWNYWETFCDLRRYHYYDLDPVTGLPVFRGLVPITTFSALNGGPNLAYRFWPTNFSEFDWNREALRKIGALNQNYHTYEMWFSQP
jgi:hypothetical protein